MDNLQKTDHLQTLKPFPSSSDPHHFLKTLLLGVAAFLIIIILSRIGYYLGTGNQSDQQSLILSPTLTPYPTDLIPPSKLTPTNKPYFEASISPTLPVKTLTPTPTPKITSWKTQHALMDGENLYILVNGKKFYGNTGNLRSHSDPGDPYHTTLESTWNENGVEMRMFMYFSYQKGKFWKLTEIRTYDGTNKEKWIYYAPLDANGNPIQHVLGEDYNNAGPLEFIGLSESGDSGTIHIEKFRIQAFLSYKINPISFRTDYAFWKAGNFYIQVDEKRFYGDSATLKLSSDSPDSGDPNYTTLEATWYEDNIEMRMFMYFSYTPGQFWRLTELRTYDGTNKNEWVFYKTTDKNGNLVQHFLGEDYNNQGPLKIYGSSENGENALIFAEDVSIQAFKPLK